MTRSSYTIAQRGNDKASMALSSIIHALFELDSYAVARMVPKDNKEPKILLLAPHIELDFECLYDVELPFAEDVRSYKFPPLDRVVTVSGRTLKMHRNLPNDELQDAMNVYVDSMELSTYGRDDDGEPAEYMPMEDTFSPKLHRINQVIKHRAIHPDKAAPPILESLTRFSHPPAELLEQADSALQRVIQAADVKKVPPKARGKRYGKKEAPKPLSDLDVDALLAQDPVRKQKRIDARNAIPEFKQLLNNADSHEQLEDACKQFKTIIFDWIRHSVGDSAYGRAVEGVHVMREEMEELESPELYNKALRELKEKLLAGQLGGERREIWFLIRSNRLGLIQRKECAGSDVDEEAAKAFLSAK
nr:atp-dependent dna helicase ii subunit 2 [Quercus suber]